MASDLRIERSAVADRALCKTIEYEARRADFVAPRSLFVIARKRGSARR
jgi:hypothetical protein